MRSTSSWRASAAPEKLWAHREPADEAFAFYDLLDANESTWAFVDIDRVGADENRRSNGWRRWRAKSLDSDPYGMSPAEY